MILPLIDRCSGFVEAQLKPGRERSSRVFQEPRPPSITVSRQVGARGGLICENLAAYLNEHDLLSICPWTLFDKNLIRIILEDHHHPIRLAQFLAEDRPKMVQAIVGEMLGLHPSLWTLFEETTETILKLARLGHAIIVGRGGAVIASGLPNVVHIRLVGSLAKRVERVMEMARMDAADAKGFLQIDHQRLMDYLETSRPRLRRNSVKRKDAEDYVFREDRARRRYIKSHFMRDIDDPLMYTMTLNTDSVSDGEAVEWIAHTVLNRAESSA